MKCKTCGYEQHYCGSCDSDIYLDEGYCNENCFRNSTEYKEEKEKFLVFWITLTEEQRRYILDEDRYVLMYSDMYEYEVDKWIN